MDKEFQYEVDEIKRGSEEKNYKDYAKKLHLEYVDLTSYPISPTVLNIIAQEDALKCQTISYLRAGNKVKIATTSPESEDFKNLINSLKEKTGFDFITAITSPADIKSALKLYGLTKTELRKENEVIEISKEEKEKFEQSIKSLRDLKEGLKKVPTTYLLDLILTGALKTEASDIHIESGEKETVIRYRMDGVLHPVISIDKETTKAIISRIKFLAKLKLDTSKLPQDGKFFITQDGRRIDIRVSSLPEAHGESIVLRLFDKEASFLKLEELGLNLEQIEKLKKAYTKTHGLIFVTGPTGSGKTTTMYAILEKLNKSGVKIITLEDPIEYDLPGVIQSQVNPEENYTFAVGLRSILRQDPDILLIGEVRDLETAEMAIQASLTGHLVLTTLHTNDSASSLHRLIDLGTRPFLIVDAVDLIISQRLVRKICPKCKEEYEPTELEKEEIKKVLGKNVKIGKLLRGKGCDFCHHSGFKGRIGIFEILELNDKLKELILRAGTLEEIKKAALESGITTMEQDGLKKSLTGLTTPEEIWRIIKD